MPDPDEIKVIRVILPGTIGIASFLIRSSGDNNDNTTFTADNSGIKQVDKNGGEMLRLWTDGTFGGDILIVDKIPAAFIGGGTADNVFVGTQIASGAQFGIIGNVAIGNSSLQNLTTGLANTAVGTLSGYTVNTGQSNTCIGNQAAPNSDASNMTLIGTGAFSDNGVVSNGIGIGYAVEVATDNTAVIGNGDITDVYFGSTLGNAILHGKGDAIVFPDSDPHIAGAGYWVAGVLTRSNG